MEVRPLTLGVLRRLTAELRAGGRRVEAEPRRVAAGTDTVWATALDVVARVDPKVVEALNLSPTVGSRIMDIAISGTLVCVAVADTVFRETFVALLDTADADEGGNSDLRGRCRDGQ